MSNLSFLAEVAQAANSIHMSNSSCVLSDHVQHHMLCRSAMHYNLEVT